MVSLDNARVKLSTHFIWRPQTLLSDVGEEPQGHVGFSKLSPVCIFPLYGYSREIFTFIRGGGFHENSTKLAGTINKIAAIMMIKIITNINIINIVTSS
jgi:hypothetical protein